MDDKLLHRDDIPYEWIENLEEKLGAKVVCLGDQESVPPRTLEKMKRLKAAKEEALRRRECWTCGKKITDVDEDLARINELNLNNWHESWKSKQCSPGFGFISGCVILCCTECLNAEPDGKLRDVTGRIEKYEKPENG